MLEIIKEMILDFQESELYTGVRRAGKSTFLNQIMRERMDSGVSNENIMYLNFFDDR